MCLRACVRVCKYLWDVHMCVYVCVHTCTCMFVHVYACVHIHVYVYVDVCVGACMCVHANTLDQEPQIPTASGASRVVQMDCGRWKLTLVLRIQGTIESGGNVANGKPVSSRRRKMQLSSQHLLPAESWLSIVLIYRAVCGLSRWR